jgi:hypothetical protein
MKESTKQYMAGFFDAEGCFTIYSAFRPASNFLGFTSQIVIASTNLPMMKWIVNNFGGVYRHRPKVKGKDAYYWIISSREHALSFLSLIKPYLVIKADQCRVLEEYLALGSAELPEERARLRDKIKALKWDRDSVTTEMPSIPNVSNAYCAGYVDGDGHISNTGLQTEGKKHLSIAALHKKFGGHFSKRLLSQKNARWSDTYIWSLHNAEKVELVLLALLPYLVEKREMALLTLERIRSCKRGKDTV